MNVYYLCQIVLAVAIVPLVAGRVRALFYTAPLEARPFLRLLSPKLGEGRLDDARGLAAVAAPAWIARMVLETLGDPEPHRASAALAECLEDLRYEATRGLVALRTLGSLASAAGMLGAIGWLIWYFQGDHGLVGLQAGRVEAEAFSGALLSVAIGLSTALFCHFTLRSLRTRSRRLLGDLEATARALEEGLGL